MATHYRKEQWLGPLIGLWGLILLHGSVSPLKTLGELLFKLFKYSKKDAVKNLKKLGEKKLYKGFLDACCPFLKGVSSFLDISCRLLDDCCSEFGRFWMMSHNNHTVQHFSTLVPSIIQSENFPVRVVSLLLFLNVGHQGHQV